LRVLDVDLGQGALGSSSAKSRHGGGGVGTLAGGQVTLRTDTVDGDASRDPLLDVAHHGLGLCVRRLVEVVVLKNEVSVCLSCSEYVNVTYVDVQLRSWVRLLRRLERDTNEVLAKHVVEHAGTEVAVLLEDLVKDL
jgi:hypothetical protein